MIQFLYDLAMRHTHRVSRRLLLALLLSALAVSAQTPPTADQVLATAKAQAAQQHKAIFLIFHASW